MEGTKDSFEIVFETILLDISDTLTKDIGDKSDGLEATLGWLQRVMEYNVPHGKKIRGRSVELAYLQLATDLTEEKLKQTRILGWCIEILQAFLLVSDDIMDTGIMRRGQPCWYRVEDMGCIALNDALLLEHAVFQIVKKYFGECDEYSKIFDTFTGITWKTILGQSVDTRMSKDRSYDRYTMSLYNFVATYKTGYYTFVLPVELALILSGENIGNEESTRLKEVLLLIGSLFQIQDDYLDCFGGDELIGKQGSDIQEGKCSWLFVTAKENCAGSIHQEKFQFIVENYGSSDKEKVAIVKALYKELGLPEEYDKCQEGMHLKIVDKIKQIGNIQLQKIVSDILAKIY